MISAQMRPAPLYSGDLNLRGPNRDSTLAVIFEEVGPVNRVVVTDYFNANQIWRGYENNVVRCRVFFDGVPSPGTVVRLPPYQHEPAEWRYCTGLGQIAIYVESDVPGIVGSAYVCSEGNMASTPCCGLLPGGCDQPQPTSRGCDLTGVWKNNVNITTEWSFVRTVSRERQAAAGLVPGERYRARERGGCGAEGSLLYVPESRSMQLKWSCDRGYSGTYSWTLDEGRCDRATGEVIHSGPRAKGQRFRSVLIKQVN
ncbi:MAG: hypothetical protein DWQ36_07115 [Acidobacteria bacterium]|nr:MAG: hypothetical protein DWQ30_24550 [Acidobacteriota bacterium]REK09311.1 MAG: hypothetical protein DWQ36_07115 [Acidobacteriota bacterium]